MTTTSVDFRAAFPQFVNTATYPDTQVDFYLDFAYVMLNADRWGAALEYGIKLFVAHFMTVDALAAQGGGVGGLPGTFVGVLSGGTVDKVSYTKDVSSIMETNAGHWGMTTYGLQFIRYARMMGAGPIQVGIGWGENFQSAVLFNGAWPGPGVPTW